MNHLWLTPTDWSVSAFRASPANSKAISATFATVVNSPSTVSFSITFLTTASSQMPSSRARAASSNPLGQLLMADDFPGPLQQRDQNVGCATTNRKRPLFSSLSAPNSLEGPNMKTVHESQAQPA